MHAYEASLPGAWTDPVETPLEQVVQTGGDHALAVQVAQAAYRHSALAYAVALAPAPHHPSTQTQIDGGHALAAQAVNHHLPAYPSPQTQTDEDQEPSAMQAAHHHSAPAFVAAS